MQASDLNVSRTAQYTGTGADKPGGGATTGRAVRGATLDEATLAELYRLHGGYLLRALLKVTSGDRCKAEDILQETFVRAWQHPEAISQGPERSRPWLFTVARRIAIDHFRMQSARPKEVSNEAPEERVLNADPLDSVLMAHDLAGALAELPPHHRDVLVELHMKGRSVAEAAKVLGVPAGTVKSRSFYAVRALRPVLEARGIGTTTAA
ncbi:sigma-70 family RNA polymerase sigma factor [Kitasatospora sp. NPDC093102]|uniref:sigma-70 family RNA polymerase sigma factor n=1 Tax=Kitasatospora sp. NPDC093102 TaxID=3155069 RepID=UPI00341B7D01